MLSMNRNQNATRRVRECNAPTGFCKVFDDHMDHLYTLSLLLTGNHQKAERCFVASLEDCLQESPEVREGAQIWAVRAVVKNAIRIVAPFMDETKVAGENHLAEPTLDADNGAAAIMALPPFRRFVYVMSILEKYSDGECSSLLDHSVEEIVPRTS